MIQFSSSLNKTLFKFQLLLKLFSSTKFHLKTYPKILLLSKIRALIEKFSEVQKSTFAKSRAL
jgi:hypothetical protein